MNKIVSFIIPVYNAEKYIEACIESVRKQTIPEWELILVDDGSTDASPQICERFAQTDNRIRVIHQENAGPAMARNNGFDLAVGQWIAFIDGDDWIEENYLECLQPYMTEDYDFIMYSYNEVRGDRKKDRCNIGKEILLEKEELRLLVMDAIDTEKRMGKVAASRSQFWTKLYRREFLVCNHIYSDVRLRTCEDVMFNLCVYEKARKAVFLPEILYNYRILDDSACHHYSEQQVGRIKMFTEAICSVVPGIDLGENAELLVQKRILVSVVNACMLDFCHKKNPESYAVRKKQFLNLCVEEPFRSALKGNVICRFSFQKQVCMWLVKFRFFWLLTLLLRGR